MAPDCIIDRVERLINAYFNYPLRKYAEVVHEIRDTGGLTPEEVRALKSKLLLVDGFTVVRQAGGPRDA